MFVSKVKRGALMMAVLAMLGGGAQAGEITDLAAKAEQQLKAGKPAQALQALDAAMDKLWAAMPLTITNATFVVSKPQGYGVYNPRNAVFKAGEPMIAYMELAGFGHKPLSGAYEIAVEGDVAIANGAGKVLAKMPGFLKSRLVSRKKNREYMVVITIDISGAPAGKYQLLVQLRDKVSGKKAQTTLPFEIRK